MASAIKANCRKVMCIGRNYAYVWTPRLSLSPFIEAIGLDLDLTSLPAISRMPYSIR